MLRPIVLTLIFVTACGTALADDAVSARGAELLGPFKTELKRALLSGLEQGPEQAIAVCKDLAPQIAGELSVNGVVVGRTSHRLRNPANVAPDWVTPILATYLDVEAHAQPVSVTLPGDRTGYVEPIVMQPLCLTCHGEALADEIDSRIRREYPEDAATGFAVGELRGVFWVEFPADD